MVINEILKAIILGIIQGITEWLPVSSTGHLIIVEDIISFQLSDYFVEAFMVIVQLASIMAVILLFFKKLNPFLKDKDKEQRTEDLKLWIKIFLATMPAAIAGYLFEDKIEGVLQKPLPIAAALIFYGLIFIIIENRDRQGRIEKFSDLNYGRAMLIGLFQMLALIPGTSRSGATIIGGMVLGASRTIAAEFSFFLSIPIMVGAGFYKLLKLGTSLNALEWLVLGIGSLTAFLVSIIIISFLMDYIKKRDFKLFGYYRIILGIVVILYFYI
ncbi:undecaprenyl-diphosphate phosphatase [Alloiococcus sp. CFN-8]|uniref:undecaprenyl-diphosphate phosphatase n=1 Tax=Alloiococcus sp. CFN-8 TaxID=3416081 RepID=UPI003CF816F4